MNGSYQRPKIRLVDCTQSQTDVKSDRRCEGYEIFNKLMCDRSKLPCLRSSRSVRANVQRDVLDESTRIKAERPAIYGKKASGQVCVLSEVKQRDRIPHLRIISLHPVADVRNVLEADRCKLILEGKRSRAEISEIGLASVLLCKGSTVDFDNGALEHVSVYHIAQFPGKPVVRVDEETLMRVHTIRIDVSLQHDT